MSSSQPLKSILRRGQPIGIKTATMDAELKQVDKRKAPDKDSDEHSDSSLSRSPMKKPRIELTRISSSTSTDAAVQSGKGLTPGDLSIGSGTTNKSTSKQGSKDIESDQDPMSVEDADDSVPSVAKFDLPSPFQPAELEQLSGPKKDGDESSNDSTDTKFFTSIIKREVIQQRLKGQEVEDSQEKIVTPVESVSVSVQKNHAAVQSDITTATRKRGRPLSQTSSPANSISPETVSSTSGPVQLYLRVFDQTKNKWVIEQIVLQSDYERLQSFLRTHGKDLSMFGSSGYSADISSQESSAELPTRSGRIAWSSLGSTINRESIVSIATTVSSVSSVPNEKNIVKKPDTPVARTRKRAEDDREPIVSSTKLGELQDTLDSSNNSKMDINLNPLSNGDDHTSNGVPKLGKASQGQNKEVKGTPKQAAVPKTPVQTPKTIKGATSVAADSSGKITPAATSKDKVTSIKKTATPSPSPVVVSAKRNNNSTPTSSSSNDKGVLTKSTKGTPLANTKLEPKLTPKGRLGKALEAQKLITATPTFSPIPTTSISSPQSIKMERGSPGTGEKPVEVEAVKLEDSDVDSLIKSSTLWGNISVGELVFARWRDKNYYSGRIRKKGLNDTWIISFDDGMEDVASETHIVPIKILGVGVGGVYSPDGIFKPANATVLGQKFTQEKEKGPAVRYAIRCDGHDRPIWCTRRQLSIREADAKELRKEFQPSALVQKAADVSLDNIVAGPRRRGNIGPPAGSPKIVGGAFDASSADDSQLSSGSSPVKGRVVGTTTPSSSEDAPSVVKPSPTTSAGTGGPAKAASTPIPQPLKDTPKENTPKLETARKPGRPRKALFEGMQFFLTASGGGDPSSSGSGTPVPVLPYDKDEYRESIESKGGKVIDSVSKEKGKENVYLISDSHARTVKYIYCLAASIPCVSHAWIGKCLDQNAVVDWKPYQLNSGWSLEQEKVILRHEDKPLKGMKIYVTAESDELYNYWRPVLTAAQAYLLKPRRKPGSVPPESEVLVTDATCDSQVLEAAGENMVPIVKPEWLVQTIITGARADFYGHEKYRVTNLEAEMCDDEAEEEEG